MSTHDTDRQQVATLGELIVRAQYADLKDENDRLRAATDDANEKVDYYRKAVYTLQDDLADRDLQVEANKETIRSLREHVTKARADTDAALTAGEQLATRVKELEDALELMADQFKRVAGERDSLVEVARTTADSGIWWMDKSLEHQKKIEQLTQELQAEHQAKAILVERLKQGGPRIIFQTQTGDGWKVARPIGFAHLDG